MSKNKIEIPVVYWKDENGFQKYDFEEMTNLFTNQLSKLDESVIVICSYCLSRLTCNTEPKINKSEVK